MKTALTIIFVITCIASGFAMFFYPPFCLLFAGSFAGVCKLSEM